jgi:hypothetical protein
MSCPCCNLIGKAELAARCGWSEGLIMDQVSEGVLQRPMRIGNQDFWNRAAVAHLFREALPRDVCGQDTPVPGVGDGLKTRGTGGQVSQGNGGAS